jgi:glyoxylase-like metal-dependent hydrolase (beta-lactamase superfamily II)
MNELERQLHYPLGDTLPAPGRAIELQPGVKWVRMGLPFALDHINLWLLRDALDGREGWTVVDCCISRDETRAQWEAVIAHELDGLPIVRVVATHMHPDHLGMAWWLCERFGCELWISAADYCMGRLASQQTTGFGGDRAAQFFAQHGLRDPEAQAQIRARSHYYPNLVPQVPPSYHRLLDGQSLSIGGHRWRCISGYGHAPEHMALCCEARGLLISGDMVLPRISTNVAVYDLEPEANPLPLFLASIDKFRALPADTLTLPSHGKPFIGLHTRIDQLHTHHQARLAEVRAACTQGAMSAADILPVLFPRTLDLHQTTFAMGEAIAHLHALWFAGDLQRVRGADGVWRFHATGASGRSDTPASI